MVPTSGGSGSGTAFAAGTIVELPAGFSPRLINNAGQIAGPYFDASKGESGVAVWSEGELDTTPLTSAFVSLLDFNDDGEMLIAVNNGLSIVSESGVTALPRPVIGGTEQFVFNGFGPDDGNQTVGLIPWNATTESNAVRYQGASPPSPITALSTIMAVNSAGSVFGQLPGTVARFGFLESGSVTVVPQFEGFVSAVDFSAAGHLLYSSGLEQGVFYDGSLETISGGFARAVNSEGVVAMTVTGGVPGSSAALRFPGGEIESIRGLVGGAPGWQALDDVVDVNDNCDAIGRGRRFLPDGSTAFTTYLATIGSCELPDFDGAFFRQDGLGNFVKRGEPADVRLRVENTTGTEVTGVTVTSIVVDTDGSGGDATVSIDGGPIGTLGTGPASVGFLDMQLTAVSEGTVSLRAEVTGNQNGEVVSGTIESEWEVRAAPLQVEVLGPDEPVQLEVRTDGPRDENGQLIDPVYIPQEVPMTVRLTVAEDSGDLVAVRPFETVDGDGGIDLDLVQRRGGELFDVVPQPVPFPATSSPPVPPPTDGGEAGTFPIERIKSGQSVDLDLMVTIEQPGTFEVSSFFEALTDPDDGPQQTIRSIGSGILPVAGEAILAIEIHADRNQGAPPRIDEGQTANFTGTVKNLSLTDTIVLSPIRAINIGQGQVLGPVELTEAFPLPGEFGFFAPELAPGPGPESEATFKIAVETTSLPGVGWELLSGRESVIIDLAVKAIVIDADGGERDLDPATDVTLDVGNGRWTNGVRVEVDPKLNPQPLLEVGDIAWALYGETAESVVSAGASFFSNIPSMISAMPAALAALGNGLVKLNSATAEAELLAVQYAWAWAEYHAQVVLSLDPAEKQAEIDAIAADLSRLYDEDFAPVAAAVNQGIEGFFTAVLDFKQRADAAGGRGDIRALIEQTGESVEVVSSVVIEEITGQAVLTWLARSARSERVANALARARERLNVEEVRKLEGATDEMRAAQVNPRVDQASPLLRGVASGTPVSPVQAIRGWAIDRVSDANLRQLTGANGRPIMVAIRSRADETLEWLETTLGITPKPVTIKPKNVNLDDCRFLGYRCGEIGYTADGSRSLGDRGSVAMREPIERSELIRVLDEAEVDDHTRTRVLNRHDKRWKEWYGEACPAARTTCVPPNPALPSKWTDLLKLTRNVDIAADGLVVRRGTIQVPRRNHPPETKDNFDTAGPDDVFDERALELREVKLDDGTSSWEVWLQDADGTIKRVSGDIDIVSVTTTDGRSFPPDSDYARDVLTELQEAADAQHPWSSSLTNPELRREFLEAHLWHPTDPLQRGEPLLIYVGGEARVGYFDPAKIADMVDGVDTDPLANIIWLEGGPNNIDAAVRRQIDLRQQLVDPLTQPTPQAHITAETKVRSALLDANQRARVAGNAAQIQATADRYATCAITTSRAVRTPAAVWRMSDRLQQRQPDGTWVDADPGDDCGDGELIILPETAINESIAAGSTTLPIIEDLLGFDWLDMFRIGDCITIDAGMPNEESACIVDRGSLILDRPLQFDHERYARVVMDTPGSDGGTPGTTEPPTTTEPSTTTAPPPSEEPADPSPVDPPTDTSPPTPQPTTPPARTLPATGADSGSVIHVSIALLVLGMALLIGSRRPSRSARGTRRIT
ncbi:MAG: hypothetical protein AAFY28_07685 [Actinomycetota bacterium]